jgi:hypothetical protein
MIKRISDIVFGIFTEVGAIGFVIVVCLFISWLFTF